MSVLRGVAEKCSTKQWDDGNTSYSIYIEGAWYTNYDQKKNPAEGSRIIAELKESKAGKLYIAEYELEGGQASAPVARQESSSSAPTSEGDTWHVKDINIAAQSAFKSLCSGQGISGEKEAKALAVIAMEISIYWDKKARAHVAGADIGAMKQSLADQVQEAVSQAPPTDAQAQDLSNQAMSEHPAFIDDDVPF